MILDEFVEVNLGGRNIQYYESLGYMIPRHKTTSGKMGVKRGTTIIVNVRDLYPDAHTKINVACDFCSAHNCIEYRNYKKTIDKYGTYCCADCCYNHILDTYQQRYGINHPFENPTFLKKAQGTSMHHYGVLHPTQNKDVQEKVKATVREHFGTDYPMQNKEIQEKSRITINSKYGTNNVFQNEDIKRKIKETMVEKYGVDNPMKSEKIKEKAYKTNMERYGVKNPSQNDDIKQKRNKTFYQNGTIRTSKQQKYICTLYQGILNYEIDWYFVDVYLETDNIGVEIDGSGHNLSVIMGQVDNDDFLKKEKKREDYLLNHSIKLIRIISKRDYYPSDQVLLQMLENAKTYFNNNCNLVIFDIDNGLLVYKNDQDFVSIPYNYSRLRKITQTDIDRILDGGEIE